MAYIGQFDCIEQIHPWTLDFLGDWNATSAAILIKTSVLSIGRRFLIEFVGCLRLSCSLFI